MISEELYKFLRLHCEERFERALTSRDKLNSTSTLAEIGIEGLDFDVMMKEFIDNYQIDDSKFDTKRYFGLGIPFIDDNIHIIRKIIGKRSWMPLSIDERKPFTLGEMELALSTGFLI